VSTLPPAAFLRAALSENSVATQDGSETGKGLPPFRKVRVTPARAVVRNATARAGARARNPRASRLTAAAPAGMLACRPLCALDHEEDAVTVRSCSLLAAAVGLWLANPHPRFAAAQETAREPARLEVQPTPADRSANQRLADAVAAKLRACGELHQYRVEVTARAGVVELTGKVANTAQRDLVVRIARNVSGVSAVRDRLEPREGGVTRATAVTQPALQEPGPLPGKEPGAMPPPPAGGGPPEPAPIFAAPPGLSYASQNPPPLPPYAWPTFAPYNNYSRVAYPTLYPYQAWPYIGPMYPFPKVPLGWRAIQLEWYNGCWWYGKRATGHDWWRVRYW
jgi:hypothetical protein